MSALPEITHSGELELLGVTVKVYRLSDGQTIFDAEDTHKVLQQMMGDADDLPADLKAQIQALMDDAQVEFQTGDASP